MPVNPLPFTKRVVKVPSATKGWFLDVGSYLPDSRPSSPPVVVMAHGIGCNKRLGLEGYAEAFAAAGYACLVFDYRRWGESDGTLRNSVFVPEMLEDYRTVIAYAKTQPEYDETRVVIWGFSFAGGHVQSLAAHAKELGICAAITTHPFCGYAKFPFEWSWLYFRLVGWGLLDFVAQAAGLGPVYVPTTARPGSLGLLTQKGALEGFRSVEDIEADFPNTISASTFFRSRLYKPRDLAPKIETPILFVVGLQDTICRREGILGCYETVPEDLKEWVDVPGDHFDAFAGGVGWDASISAQLAFLAKHLGRPGT